MSIPFFLVALSLLVGGSVLLKTEFRLLGGALSGLAVAAFLMRLPWVALSGLARSLPGVRLWLVMHREAARSAWSAASAAMGIAAGLGAAGANRGSAEVEREVPDEGTRIDAAFESALGEQGPGAGTLLGVTRSGRAVCVLPREREGHMQIVGPTRSGKSQLLLALAAQDMAGGLPVFFMEAKGDRGDFDQFLKAAGRCGRLAGVRYFNPQDPRSMTFNPIRPVAGQDATALANQVARAIGREPTSSGEGQDYYRGVDYAKVQSMAEVFCATGRAFTLRDCYDYFAFPDARAKAFDLCGDAKLVDLAAAEFRANEDTSSLTSALRPWTTGALGALLNSYSPEIRLEDAFARGQAVYFAVPVGHLQVLANPLGRMVISGLLSVAASRQRAAVKPDPATVVLDEFAEFATPAFASFVATVGSARMRTVLSHQDLGQLKRIQGMDADAFESAVFNNTSGCKVCFRAPDPEDAEFWAATLGTEAGVVDTERITRGFLGDARTGERSRRAVERFRIHPNKIKGLPPGAALVSIPGRETCLVRT
ncbi:MAG: type IV secretory system conjugative DNA transfer family protein, partial [Elusimicrobia bacterium]|nr:type IV secretory system conjugative DNA transfer family protein [Elusimicrobiota bacterium]